VACRENEKERQNGRVKEIYTERKEEYLKSERKS
jgi:hypothetical protein